MINFLFGLGLFIVCIVVCVWGAKCAIAEEKHASKIRAEEKRLYNLKIVNELDKAKLIRSQLKTEDIIRKFYKGL